MEASTVAKPEAPAEPQASHDGVAEATRSTEELFQWSSFVHVGTGAEECEHGADGTCRDKTHFHAWVCLPNAFQVRDIVDKARAAQARKKRALRDPESDASAVLEAELDDLRTSDYEGLKRNQMSLKVQEALPEMVDHLRGDDRFEHYDQDREEFLRQEALPEEERDAEEYPRLEAQVTGYTDALREMVEKREERELTRLSKMDPDEVVELERRQRIELISREAYMHTYYTWATYIGARTAGLGSERRFGRPEDLHGAAPEVVSALRTTLHKLETRTIERGDAAGNF